MAPPTSRPFPRRGFLRPDALAAAALAAFLVVTGGSAQEPDVYRVSIDPIQARRGDRNVAAVVRLTTPKDFQGYSVLIGYDRAAMTPTGVDLTGTVTDRSYVELTNMERYPRLSVLTFDMLTEYGAPFEGKKLAAGENLIIFKLLFDVPETAPEGDVQITFPESISDPPLANTILVEDQRQPLIGTPAALTVLPPKPPPNEDRLELPSVNLAPGETGQLTVLASVSRDLEAYTVIIGYDPEIIEVTAMDLAGSAVEPLEPELVAPRIENEFGHSELTVIFDFLPPLDRRALAAGDEQRLLTVHLRVASDAPAGVYPITFPNQIGVPPLNNIFVYGAQSYLPERIPGEVIVGGQTEPSFIRGDYDTSGLVDLSDAVALVNHLFQGGPLGGCDDAGDADDTGILDLTDAIQILNHLFQGGSPLPAPYPDPGTDPTADELGCGEEGA